MKNSYFYTTRFRLTAIFAVMLGAQFALAPYAYGQTYYSLGGGYYCIDFPDGSNELGLHSGNGNVSLVDTREEANKLAKKAVRIRKKLKAAKNYIRTNGGASQAFQKLFKVKKPNIEKAKKLVSKLNRQLKEIESLRNLFEDCENEAINFTGAGSLSTLFVYPAPNDLPSRNYNVVYVPLTVNRTKKGKVKTNTKFCLSYIKREDRFADSFKLAPFEYIVNFYNDPCFAGRLSGSSCPNFFGDKNDFGYIISVLNGLGPDEDVGWQEEQLSQITVVARPMGKIGCLGDSGFRK